MILKATPLKQQSQQVDKEDHEIEYNVKKWQRLQYAHNNKEINVGREGVAAAFPQGLRPTEGRMRAQEMTPMWHRLTT